MKSEAMLPTDLGETALGNKQIFVVDDDVSICRSLVVLLGAYGYNVDSFSSGESFLNTVSNSTPGCLILDIHMPGLDGWGTLKRLLASGSTRPVIIISTDKKEGLGAQALEAGAIGYLQKPFNDRELVDLIKIALKKNRKS